MLKKIITILLLLISIQSFAIEKYYLNAANTSENQNSEIYAATKLLKQNIKDADSIKFNSLYLTTENGNTTVCGNFQTALSNTAPNFIASQGSLLIENKESQENNKAFQKAWQNFCQ